MVYFSCREIEQGRKQSHQLSRILRLFDGFCMSQTLEQFSVRKEGGSSDVFV